MSPVILKYICYSKSLQSLFEIITSEASYLKSLNIVTNHFMEAEGFNPVYGEGVLKKHEYHTIFSNIYAVKKVSNK